MITRKQIAALTAAFIAGLMLGEFHPGWMSSASAEGTYTIETCLQTLNRESAETTTNGWMFWFVKRDFSDGLNLKMSQVNAHSAIHGAHKHPEKEIYYILDGEAEFTLDGVSRTVGKDSAMYCPPNVMHGIHNAGDGPLRYLVIKDN
ncbi:MAG: cupin domain-containing protein [bacterium]|nr:cupin domain-containing protein [bacterium]